MSSVVDSRAMGVMKFTIFKEQGAKSKQREFKDFLEESGIVKCINVAFATLFDQRPKTEEGLVYFTVPASQFRTFQRIMAKSYILEIEGDKQKIEDDAKQIFDLTTEKANLIRENQNLRLENMELRRLRKQERKEKREIRKQLIQIRKELRLAVRLCSSASLQSPNAASLPEVEDVLSSSDSDSDVEIPSALPVSSPDPVGPA